MYILSLICHAIFIFHLLTSDSVVLTLLISSSGVDANKNIVDRNNLLCSRRYSWWTQMGNDRETHGTK